MVIPLSNLPIRNRYLVRSVVNIFLAASFFLVASSASAQDLPNRDHLGGQPGYLVIEGARQEGAGFRWEPGPEPGRRTLVWEQGRLTVADSAAVDDFALHDLGLAYSDKLSGLGASGQVLLVDGIYPVSEPIVLQDTSFELELTGGELEFRGARIRYRRSVAAPSGISSNLLLLSGMLLMIIVLVRRARLKVRERSAN